MQYNIIFKSFNKILIEFTCQEIKKFLFQNKIVIVNTFCFPIKTKRFCVLRSPHIDNDSREHFDLNFYKRSIICNLSANKIKFLLTLF